MLFFPSAFNGNNSLIHSIHDSAQTYLHSFWFATFNGALQSKWLKCYKYRGLLGTVSVHRVGGLGISELNEKLDQVHCA